LPALRDQSHPHEADRLRGVLRDRSRVGERGAGRVRDRARGSEAEDRAGRGPGAPGRAGAPGMGDLPAERRDPHSAEPAAVRLGRAGHRGRDRGLLPHGRAEPQGPADPPGGGLPEGAEPDRWDQRLGRVGGPLHSEILKSPFRSRSISSVKARLWLGILALALSASVGCQRGGLSPGEGRIEVPGGRIWYRIVGSGTKTPLLVLHGGPGMSSAYLSPLAALADERPVIFYDQLGAGRSDRPTDSTLWTVDRFVQEIPRIRQALGLREVHLYGHSWGTILAVEYLLTQPQGVRSVILSSPAISIQ